MPKYAIENAHYSEAKRALEENLSLLDPQKHKTAHNLTVALAYILQTQSKLANDIELLHRKLQPILKYLEEENADWRNRYPRYED